MSSNRESLVEQRVALILNGGVSLAVWMAGVVSEIYLVSRLGQSSDSPAEGPAAEAWRTVINKSTCGPVTIDLIAGSSAGGLNGAFLAQAIAVEDDLNGLKSMWLDLARLDPSNLLNDVPEKSTWALDGSFFELKIAERLPARRPSRPPGERSTVTLLTTASAVGAEPQEAVDDHGRSYHYRDSRRVYAFRQRGWTDQSDFDDVNLVAHAARASASYPVAFMPVDEAHHHLRDYRVVGSGDSSMLMDGGVLDNAPFEPLLEELRSMPTSGRSLRHVVYVTPEVERLPSGRPAEDDWLSELGRVVSVAREGDQRLDEDALRLFRRDASYQQSSPFQMLVTWLTSPERVIPVSLPLLRQYCLGRAEALHVWLDVDNHLNYQTPPGVWPSAEPVEADDLGHSLDLAAHPLPWDWGLSVALRIGNWYGRALNHPSAKRDTREAFRAVQALQRFVADHSRPIASAENFDLKDAALRSFYGSESKRDQLGRLVQSAAESVDEVFLGPDAPSAALEYALRIEVLTNTWAWRNADGADTPPIRYTRITPATTLDTFTGPAAHDPELERAMRRKLYGQRWAHFGAFATTRARRHDWLWGRLDATASLVGLLIDDPDLAKALSSQVVEAILEEELAGLADPETDAGSLRSLLVSETKSASDTDGKELFQRLDQECAGAYDNVWNTLFGLLSQTARLRAISPWVRVVFGKDLLPGDKDVLPPWKPWLARRVAKHLEKRIRHWLMDG